MAILTRPKINPQQRFDLEDWNALLSAFRTDSKLFSKNFYSNNNRILSGFSLSGIGALEATINLNNAALIIPENTSDFSFFISDDATSTKTIEDSLLTANATNYVEIQLCTVDGNPLPKAFWDSSANGGSGGEFAQTVNTITDLDFKVVVSTTGFSNDPNNIKLGKLILDAGATIQAIQDDRSLIFAHRNDFSITQLFGDSITLTVSSVTGTFTVGEPAILDDGNAYFQNGVIESVVGSTIVVKDIVDQNAPLTGLFVYGSTSGASAQVDSYRVDTENGDKSIKTLDDAFQAIYNEIKAIKNTPHWYDIPTVNAVINATSVQLLNSTITQQELTGRYEWDGSLFSITDDNGSTSSIPARVRVMGNAQTVDKETILAAIDALDLKVDALEESTRMKDNIKIIGSGNFKVTEDGNFSITSTVTEPIFLTGLGLQDAANQIAVTNSLMVDGYIYYVTLNPSNDTPTNLPVSLFSTPNNGTFTPDDNTYIIAQAYEGGVKLSNGVFLRRGESWTPTENTIFDTRLRQGQIRVTADQRVDVEGNTNENPLDQSYIQLVDNTPILFDSFYLDLATEEVKATSNGAVLSSFTTGLTSTGGVTLAIGIKLGSSANANGANLGEVVVDVGNVNSNINLAEYPQFTGDIFLGFITLGFSVGNVVAFPSRVEGASIGNGTGGGDSKSTSIEQIAHGFAVGHTLFRNPVSGLYEYADPADEDKLATVVVVEETGANTFEVQSSGLAVAEGHGFVVGETYYVDQLGAFTTTRSTELGEYDQTSFFVVDPDTLLILVTQRAILITEANGVIPPSPYFEGERTSGSINLTTGQETLITFPDELSNVGGISNGLGTYTIPEDGLYNVSMGLLLNSSSAWEEAEYFQISIITNDGVNAAKRRVLNRVYQDTGFAWANGDLTLSLTAGTTIEFNALQVSDVTLSTYTTADIYVRGIIAKVGQNTSLQLPSVVTAGTIKKQTKFLGADITSDTNIADLAFNNLVVGKTYRLTYNLNFIHSIDGTVGAAISHDGNIIARPKLSATQTGTEQITNHETLLSYVIPPFVATGTSVTIESVFIQAGDIIRGNGTLFESSATIEELPYSVATTTEF